MKTIIFAGSLVALTALAGATPASAVSVRIGPGGVGVGVGGPRVVGPRVRRAPVVVAPRVVAPRVVAPVRPLRPRRGPAIIIR